VKGVVEKLLLGGADAGITYVTDIGPRERETLRAEPLPEAAQVRPSYLIATTRTSADAERLLAYVLGPRGRAHLRAQGFGLP
jgi:ABC-type molybdate transport system substrate-binding protein